jgi:hypothetical protein
MRAPAQNHEELKQVASNLPGGRRRFLNARANNTRTANQSSIELRS